MKILIEEKDLDKLEVLLSETHRWIESDGFFEVQAHLTNMGFLEQWFGNSQLQIYLHTNYYYSLEEQQEEQNLGLPRKISLRGFFDWLDKSEFDGSIESFNNLFLGDISHIQISLGAKKMKILIEKTEEKKEEVWNKLEQWIREHKAVCGETVMQSDSCNLSAPEILSEILDEVIKPRIVWENDLEL